MIILVPTRPRPPISPSVNNFESILLRYRINYSNDNDEKEHLLLLSEKKKKKISFFVQCFNLIIHRLLTALWLSFFLRVSVPEISLVCVQTKRQNLTKKELISTEFPSSAKFRVSNVSNNCE